MQSRVLYETHTLHLTRTEYRGLVIEKVRAIANKYYQQRLIKKSEFKRIARNAVKKVLNTKNSTKHNLIQYETKREIKKVLRKKKNKKEQERNRLRLLEIMFQAIKIQSE